jgi:hypothetical protein
MSACLHLLYSSLLLYLPLLFSITVDVTLFCVNVLTGINFQWTTLLLIRFLIHKLHSLEYGFDLTRNWAFF